MNPSTNNIARASDEQPWREEPLLNLARVAAALAFGVALVFCWRAAEMRPTALFEPGTAAALWAFIRGLFPPDFSLDFLGVVSAAIIRTAALAIAGTTLAIVIGLPLGVMSTSTLWQRGVLLAGEPPGVRKFALAWLSRGCRELLGFLRAVPDLMWGLLFVVAVGLGPLAGTLALGVSYGGVLGRVYADVFEDVDSRALEALHATGATHTQVFLRAIWPQAKPSIVAYTLYLLECCARSASVLGFIGAGGIGYEINLSMRLFEYGQVLTLIVALVGLVAVTDFFSRYLRRRLHANVPAGSLAHQHIADEPSLRSHEDRRARATLLIFIAVVAASFFVTGFFTGTRAGLLTRIVRFSGEMFPPDLDPAFLRLLAVPLVQTIGISVMGTLIGIAIGAVLSLPATSTLAFAGEDDAGGPSLLNRALRAFVYCAARLGLNLLRSIPELVWVLMCIVAVGLGPFAGTLAIGLHTGGVLGKLYAETLEEVPARPVEALRASGARPLQILLWGIWPQARPMLVSYTVLRWEMNIRVSTILGLVGGGGLGQAIYNNVQLGFYSRTTTIVAIVYALVIVMDWLGDRLRNRRTAI
ncbi:MAG TPA: phosphate/phosphonate ABC transporter permease [Blastocatellia bacterium]|nr:phosphate/phosphonate ABC transporter permease [Blastocatellia bacterium]